MCGGTSCPLGAGHVGKRLLRNPVVLAIVRLRQDATPLIHHPPHTQLCRQAGTQALLGERELQNNSIYKPS